MADETVTTEKHKYEDEVNAENAKRSGKGTRLKFGNTRGKGSIPIMFETFDESKPDTLPVSTEEFLELTKIDDDKVIVKLLISGYNDLKYTEASDPIAEFVNLEWDDIRQTAFRTVVRQMAKNAEISIEEAVAMVKPGFEAAFAKAKASAK